MKKIIIGFVLMSVFSLAYASTAFLKGETVSGMNKICFYDNMGSEVAITIGAAQLCPLTIHVK